MELERFAIKEKSFFRVSEKREACYSHGYGQRQFNNTFLVPSLCYCYERYNKECCIWNPPHTIVIYYRFPGSLTLIRKRLLNNSLFRRSFTIHTHCSVISKVSKKLNFLSDTTVNHCPERAPHTPRCCSLSVAKSDFHQKGSYTI